VLSAILVSLAPAKAKKNTHVLLFVVAVDIHIYICVQVLIILECFFEFIVPTFILQRFLRNL
jgi:hypothetical protein